MKRFILYIIVAAVAYYAINKFLQRKKYLDYLHSLGFRIADDMTGDEVKTSYIYLHDYARKYGAQAGKMLQDYSPLLYAKAKAISQKYQIFNL